MLIEDYADEIQKCSKCGLCQAVCPVYKVTGNDCAVRRGRLVMLDGVLKGDLKFNKTIKKYLDMCLNCGKCTDVCPSGGKCMGGEQMYRGGATAPHQKTDKVLYFSGCFNRFLHKHPLKKLIDIEDPGFGCCGLPYRADVKRFKKSVERNRAIAGDRLVITDCASCAYMLKKYGINAVNAVEYLVDNKETLKQVQGDRKKVTFHKPCHMKNIDFLKPLLKNVEYIEMNDFDACCGFGGEFALKHNKISRAISRQKAENILATGADIVLTACPGCVIGLHQGFLGRKAPKIMNILEFISQNRICALAGNE